MTEQEVKNLIKELDKSAVYNMSLGSKELFHSNFWAWLINKYNKFVGVFFSDLENENVEVKREEGNRDLSIRVIRGDVVDDSKIYVIENKLKSMPDESQLKKYENDIGVVRFGKGVITGLRCPYFIKDNEKEKHWEFISYEEIGSGIESRKSDVVWEDNDNILVEKYYDMIKKINQLINYQIDNFDQNTLTYSGAEVFEKIRLDDIYKKLKVSDFAVYFVNYLKNDDVNLIAPNGYELEIKTGYSDGNANIDIDWKKLKEDGEPEIRVGIQIQGNQYRRFVAKYPKCKIEDVYDEYLKNNWFGFRVKNNKTIFNDKKTGMQGDRCKYETAEYTFVYQHWKIDENGYTAYSELAKIIKEDLKTAKKIIEANN